MKISTTMLSLTTAAALLATASAVARAETTDAVKPIMTVSQTEAMRNGLKCGLENGMVNGELRTTSLKGGTQEKDHLIFRGRHETDSFWRACLHDALCRQARFLNEKTKHFAEHKVNNLERN